MSLQDRVMEAMKAAMKGKDSAALDALRAIKSAILLAKTQSGAKESLSEGEEISLLQKLVKQRKDSASLYKEKGREDPAATELAQVQVIAQFLPKPLSEADLSKMVEEVIARTGAQSMKDMGRVMGELSKAVAGRADGKTIANMVRQKLM